MRAPKVISATSLTLVVILAACGSTADETPPSSANVAEASATPTSLPAPSPDMVPSPIALPSARPMSLLWEAHGPVTEKTSTVYVAINPLDGNVWVGVPFESRFWIFSPDGTYLESWGEGGTGPGQFDFSDHAQYPSGFAPIAFAPDGSFYVGDTGNFRIQHFGPDRAFIGQWGAFGPGDGKFVEIVTIATDGTTVYVGDGRRQDIQAFEARGAYLRTLGGEGGYDVVVLDRDGRIHATNPQFKGAEPQGLAIFDADGSVVSTTPLDPPSGVTVTGTSVDDAGNSYVELQLEDYPYTGEGIIELDSTGRAVGRWEGGGDGFLVTPAGDAMYITQGIQLDSRWTFVRKYALAGS
jgi:hypothetical protein